MTGTTPIDVIIQGDCLEELRKLPSEAVDCCITSPPYFGLRDYGVDGQIGLEESPEAYVSKLVEVFREVRRVLKKEGTLWLNLGDSYAGSWGNYHPNSPPGKHGQRLKETARWNRPAYKDQTFRPPTSNKLENGIKPKDLIGIPWMVAFALRADGWWLRSDIIWANLSMVRPFQSPEPNCMPESVTDRPTKSHEYLFLLSKSQNYFYDHDAVKEKSSERSVGGEYRNPSYMKKCGSRNDGDSKTLAKRPESGTRNKRTVWTIPTKPFKEAHFATFPEKLIEPCVLAGCPEGGICLDPFFGAGTTGLVAKKIGRRFIGIELNPEYISMAQKRIAATPMRLDNWM